MARKKEVTYDLTVTVRGHGGSLKVKHTRVARAAILEGGCADLIRRHVELYEEFVVPEESSEPLVRRRKLKPPGD